jgi:hypothetical protein
VTKTSHVGLENKSHKSQLRNKMFKNKMNDRIRANDVNVINKGRENIRGKIVHKTL